MLALAGPGHFYGTCREEPNSKYNIMLTLLLERDTGHFNPAAKKHNMSTGWLSRLAGN